MASLNDYWTQLKLDLLFAPDPSKNRDQLSISGGVEQSEQSEQNEPEKPAETEESTVQEIKAEEKPESMWKIHTALFSRDIILLRHEMIRIISDNEYLLIIFQA